MGSSTSPPMFKVKVIHTEAGKMLNLFFPGESDPWDWGLSRWRPLCEDGKANCCSAGSFSQFLLYCFNSTVCCRPWKKPNINQPLSKDIPWLEEVEIWIANILCDFKHNLYDVRICNVFVHINRSETNWGHCNKWTAWDGCQERSSYWIQGNGAKYASSWWPPWWEWCYQWYWL